MNLSGLANAIRLYMGRGSDSMRDDHCAGDPNNEISVIGVTMSAWTLNEGLVVADGAIFWMVGPNIISGRRLMLRLQNVDRAFCHLLHTFGAYPLEPSQRPQGFHWSSSHRANIGASWNTMGGYVQLPGAVGQWAGLRGERRVVRQQWCGWDREHRRHCDPDGSVPRR